MGVGYQEMIIIFLIVLLLFGGRKIPEIARGLGKGIHEFRKARDDIRDAIEHEAATGESKPQENRSARAPSPPAQTADQSANPEAPRNDPEARTIHGQA